MSYFFSYIKDELINRANPKQPFVGRVSAACKVDSLERFGEVACLHALTPAIFKDNVKRLDHLYSVSWLFFDFDDGTSHSKVIETLPTDIDYIIIASQNHMRDKNDGNGIRERYHLFIATEPFREVNYHKFTLKSFSKKYFPYIDKQCLESSRFFATHRETLHINHGQILKTTQFAQEYEAFKKNEELLRQKRLAVLRENKKLLEDATIEAVLENVIESLPFAVEGNGGDKECFKAACKIIKFGGDFSHFEIYNNVKCDPEFSDKELEHKWEYAEAAVGLDRYPASFIEYYYNQVCKQ